MKKVSKRAVLLLLLAGILVLGVAFFSVEYFMEAENWVTFSGSPHVYSGGNLSMGSVTDRDGTVLLENTADGRTYAEDAALRTACLHVLGDREGYVQSGLLNAYTDEMIGYSKTGGLYHVLEGGNTLTLTLSAQVQTAAYEALSGYRGTVGVYNYKTGELLCMVSTPAYDPDAKPAFDETDPAWEGVYVNRFLSSTYVPGSIFKLVTLTAALEQLPQAEAMSFWCGGSMELAGGTVTCTGTHGNQTLSEALTNSCNCAFGILATQVGGQALEETAKRLGICSGLCFDGITTASGQCVATNLADNALAWAGIGQYQDLVNPCQYLTVLGAIANGGQAASPYVVQSVKTPLGIKKYQAETTLLEPVMEEMTADTVAAYMEAAVTDKYGAENFSGLTVGAKSGTAEMGDGTDNAMLVGFAADEDCPVAFFIAVEGGGYGAATCVPIAAKVLAACREALNG